MITNNSNNPTVDPGAVSTNRLNHRGCQMIAYDPAWWPEGYPRVTAAQIAEREWLRAKNQEEEPDGTPVDLHTTDS